MGVKRFKSNSHHRHHHHHHHHRHRRCQQCCACIRAAAVVRQHHHHHHPPSEEAAAGRWHQSRCRCCCCQLPVSCSHQHRRDSVRELKRWPLLVLVRWSPYLDVDVDGFSVWLTGRETLLSSTSCFCRSSVTGKIKVEMASTETESRTSNRTDLKHADFSRWPSASSAQTWPPGQRFELSFLRVRDLLQLNMWLFLWHLCTGIHQKHSPNPEKPMTDEMSPSLLESPDVTEHKAFILSAIMNNVGVVGINS